MNLKSNTILFTFTIFTFQGCSKETKNELRVFEKNLSNFRIIKDYQEFSTKIELPLEENISENEIIEAFSETRPKQLM
jgi:hypothetical protein